MHSRFHYLIALLIVGCMLMAGTAQAKDATHELRDASVISKVIERGTLRVGFSTFVPWAMNDKTGKFIGFEVDVMTQLAKDLGVEIEFVPTNWSGIIPSLLSDKFDVIIGGMSVTTERNLKVNFTIPYDTTGMALVANKTTAKGFSSLADFNKEDVIIVARIGSTPATAAKTFFPKATLRLFEKETQCLQELLSGRVHAFVASAPLPAHSAVEHADKLFLPVEGTFTKEPVAFAVRKGDPDTLNVLNNWIRQKEAQGWLAERKHYWFETLDWAARLK
ncbi:transporter substrate-binding domain-containing protein [Desulfovibrio subterraneus]|uniref:Amino acid ABC transporter substrate-binding protein n=1 Tax=Desulfovibrio subterraneus TaxID=2718620 RepID=A0A7J0BGD4_9BACT|nr:amino acid ABC transporter substrate-binding protein [Desulfovibrio subterraneus]